MSVDNSPIVQEFLIESFESISQIGEELTLFEKNLDDSELLNSIYRRVHTIKGSASFLGFKTLEHITHAAENIMDSIREKSIHMDSAITDILLESFDVAHEILKSIESTGNEGENAYTELNKKLVFLFENKSLPDEKPLDEPKIVTGHKNDELSPVKEKSLDQKNESLELDINNKEKTEAPVVKETVSVQKETGDKVEEKKTSSKEGSSNNLLKDSVVRVNVQLLDKIMNVVGELVLNRNQILQFSNSLDSHQLTRLAQQLNVITTDLQTDIMTTRMQPVGTVISKFERIVRDLAKSQGKSISLNISGKDTELDKTLLEAIRDPLTHLIRNSVDHGIETSEVRLKKGKPSEGNINIKAYHEGGQVTIEIIDDGNGIDPDKVLIKAIEKGIYTEAQAAKLTEKQILNLIFHPGFSTKEEITNLSGRGVGMDVVKSNIENVGGSVELSSKVGQGTNFKLKIPLTLAIVPALVVESNGETFAIPQANLLELVRFEGEEVSEFIEEIHGSEFFRLRGDLIPIFRINEVLGIDKVDKTINYAWENQLKEEKNVTEENDERESDEGFSGEQYDLNSDFLNDSLNIAILNADDNVYGLIVDSVLDTEEIVVKPLSKKLKELKFYAGATIMGDGSLALILDAIGFFNSVEKEKRDTSQKNMLDFEEEILSDVKEKQEVLLAGLGDGRVYGIPLILVSRLEEFPAEEIEYSGNQALIRYGNTPMPLFNLEKTLGLNGESFLRPENISSNKVIPCVVVKLKDRLFGFVVHSIQDIAISVEHINTETIDREGLLGTVYVNEKTVTLLDVHTIINLQKVVSNNKKYINKKNNGIILLVEDSPLYRKIESEFLIEQGFEVVEAQNGEEGLAIYSSDPAKISFVVTDLDMPTMDGYEMAGKIRALSDIGSKVPILALSTSITDKEVEKGSKAGINAYEEKFNKENILKVLTGLMAS
ncbi:MAG: chemotaxis protein CheW [Bacteriovoracaceae bacterium]